MGRTEHESGVGEEGIGEGEERVLEGGEEKSMEGFKGPETTDWAPTAEIGRAHV